MHSHRLAAFLLGGWIVGGMFMVMVATQNFRAVDRLLASPAPQAAQPIQTLGGRDAARMFLRYHSSELNRFYFQTWELIQLGLGLVLLLALTRGGSRTSQLLCVVMLLILCAQHWGLTPRIVQVGRAIDFISPAASDERRDYFWRLHSFYSSSEVGKEILGLILGVLLIKKSRRSTRGPQPAETFSTPVGHTR